MKDLTPEQIAAAEEAMKAHRNQMKSVATFINEPIKDKHGKEKPMSLHMRTDYIACALDELNERAKNSICLHAAQMHALISVLYKRVEKLEGERYDLDTNE